jgi:poly-gamma-glutamate synthesis protein (capsule biosynthesis protein)
LTEIGRSNAPSATIEIGNQSVLIIGISFPAPDPLRWRNARHELNVTAPTKALRQLKAFRSANPDSFLVVYIHWGYELSELPYPADRAWAREAADAGVDLIVGHHPHVVQPLERFGRTIVAYSLGNFHLPEGEWHSKKIDYLGKGSAGLALLLANNGITLYPVALGHVDRDRPSAPESHFAEFLGMDDNEYLSFFKRVAATGMARTPKGVPLMKRYSLGFEEAFFIWQDFRQALRNFLVRLGVHIPGKCEGAVKK